MIDLLRENYDDMVYETWDLIEYVHADSWGKRRRHEHSRQML